MHRFACISLTIVVAVFVACRAPALLGQFPTAGPGGDKATGPQSDEVEQADPRPQPPAPRRAHDPVGATRIDQNGNLWVDLKRKRVIVDGEVVFRRGQLEMFACLTRTKEHESIVALPTKAMLIHGALLAIGAKPGHPVQFRPEYKPATGSKIDIVLLWTDENGERHQARAQNWVRNAQTKKELAHPWVFGGSVFATNPRDGTRFYQAERGEVICVSNFGTAMLDIPIESSGVNEELVYEAWTERIPPRGTKVRLVLTVAQERAAQESAGAGSEKTEKETTRPDRP